MIHEVEAKTILNTAKTPSGWFGVLYNMNIYRGCQHDCIYCDSRSACYRIDKFDDVIIKKNAPELLRKEIAKKRKRGTIGTGAMSDPYMPIEKEYKLVRQCLEIIKENNYPVHICTKSNLILRDADLLKEINKVYACVAFTLTTTDDELAKIIEPQASLPSERLMAMGVLSSLGIKVGVTMMPILPYIEDNEENIIDIVKKAKQHGASFIYPAFGMTLRDQQREYYYNKLDESFDGLKEKYMKSFKNRYSCSARNYKKLKAVFQKACAEADIHIGMVSYNQKVSDAQMNFFNEI